ncbi:hypothetical protein MKY30_23810 [Oceanobacillus sp. FSL W8-0428]|uniref:hypothetical protein n=1 Tax=Oceanobacillus sp. FSL W8-0428 TaxID=2921715 RepID=UPI0030F5407B
MPINFQLKEGFSEESLGIDIVITTGTLKAYLPHIKTDENGKLLFKKLKVK